VKVNGKLCYLWRAVDHEGEALDAVVTAKRDKAAALKLLKRIMERYGRPRKIVTDGLCSYCAAMKRIDNADRHEVGRRLNNREENSHQAFRRRERAMRRFRRMKTLQKFSSVHAEVHNHFNQERHLVTRQVYKQRQAGALAEWRALAANVRLGRPCCAMRRRPVVTLTEPSSASTSKRNQIMSRAIRSSKRRIANCAPFSWTSSRPAMRKYVASQESSTSVSMRAFKPGWSTS
jgi:IS1 family transposase